MHTAQNPILPGFNPDPSICRVGDDYFVATSTFEWYPGVQIHHSKDLKNWRLVARPLNRPSLLNMLGNPDSGGVWAPCLTWHQGLFYLVYTDVKRLGGDFKDTHNFLTSCERIDGEWRDPIYLNSSGFDPSLFHDEDERKWLVNMLWDHRPGRTSFHGIVLQEFSVPEERLIGESQVIFQGTELGITEAPHLYRHEGYYYLMTAEGGTGYRHAVTLARAKAINGPYEADPAGPLLTSADAPSHPLQRAGHGDFLQAANGKWYLVHLTGRPLSTSMRRCTLGRETALQQVEWTDEGWLRLVSGGHHPAESVDIEGIQEQPWPDSEHLTKFESTTLPPEFQWLRTPFPEDLFSLRARPGYLRLYGREAIGSQFTQALVARRFEHHAFYAETQMEFDPKSFQQMAGLTCYYNSTKFHYLFLSLDEAERLRLGIMSCEANSDLAATFPMSMEPQTVRKGRAFRLGVKVKNERLRFCWGYAGEALQDIGPVLDASILSDETGKGEGAQFTGAFVGMCAQDSSGNGRHADFCCFLYEPSE